MELLGKLASNDKSKIIMTPTAPKDISIKILEQGLQIITNNDQLNVIKGITKIQNRESIFTYQ